MILLKCILQFAVILIIIQCMPTQCNSDDNQSDTPTAINSSLINSGEKQINVYDSSSSEDKRKNDKILNNREFPPSPKLKRNFDKSYLADYEYEYEYGVSPASDSELPECILSRSEFYLSWWVNEDGTLRASRTNRTGNSPGFVDLSLKFRSEEAIFKHVSKMTSDNPLDVDNSL